MRFLTISQKVNKNVSRTYGTNDNFVLFKELFFRVQYNKVTKYTIRARMCSIIFLEKKKKKKRAKTNAIANFLYRFLITDDIIFRFNFPSHMYNTYISEQHCFLYRIQPRSHKLNVKARLFSLNASPV